MDKRSVLRIDYKKKICLAVMHPLLLKMAYYYLTLRPDMEKTLHILSYFVGT